MSSDTTYGVHQLPEPIHVESPIVQALLSSPPTVNKHDSIFLESSSQDEEDEKRPRTSNLAALLPFHWSRRVRVRVLCLLAALLGLFCWFRRGHVQDIEYLKQRASNLTKDLLFSQTLEGFHFVPASNQNFHFVGRWTHTPNRLRRDGNSAGAYLEFGVRNCSSIYASLHNTDTHHATREITLKPRDVSVVTHLDFRPLSDKTSPARPVSLVSRIDGDEYKYFHRSGKGLVAIAAADLDASVDHVIRIIAPGNDDDGLEGIEFQGVWLDDGASLISEQRKSTPLETVFDAASLLPTMSSKLLRSGMETNGLQQTRGGKGGNSGSQHLLPGHRKTVEIATDLPQSFHGPVDNGSLATLKGYGDLIGDMFGVDHVRITMDGMCLTSPCIGGTGQPMSVNDAFFRSGPPGLPSFARSWNFRSYVPDALILVLGTSDETSFRKHIRDYEKTPRDLQRQFEEAYVKFVQGIRRAAYPLHPAALHDYASNADGFVYNSAAATIPIFVVAPFTGEMRHSTQKVVEKLQSEGDKAAFWLDTSGWFLSEDFHSDVSHGVDGEGRRLLNSQGNRKAAAFLHGHLCHYLAEDRGQCPFLKHEAYTGKVYVPKDVELGKLMEDAKIRKLKALFWPEDKEQSRGSGEALE